MYSFNFPQMIGNVNSKLLKDKDAVRSNIVLLLGSEITSLFGDPYYGCQLKHALYEQSGTVIVDLLIDEFYTVLTTFIPQIFIDRKNINIYYKDNELYATIKYIYLLDNTADLYTIKLTTSENM